MAAAAYYQPSDAGAGLAPPRPTMPTSHQPSSSYLGPPPPPQRASSQPNVNFTSPLQQSWQPQPSSQYSQGPPPPPYEPLSESVPKPSVHFAATPRPSQDHRPNSFSGGQRPNLQPWAPGPFQQAQNPQLYPQQQYTPQGYQSQQGALVYQNNYSQPPRPGSSHLRPHDPNQSSADLSSSSAGYNSDPEPHRRRHKHHHKSQSKSRSRSRSDYSRASHGTGRRRTSDASRSANADGFIGAAGGGLIGDLIFPGLGTVGGAVAGWLGGRGYGERRKSREDRRDRSQYEWEERFGKPHPADGYHPSERASHHHYEKDGYERRRSYDDRERERRRENY